MNPLLVNYLSFMYIYCRLSIAGHLASIYPSSLASAPHLFISFTDEAIPQTSYLPLPFPNFASFCMETSDFQRSHHIHLLAWSHHTASESIDRQTATTNLLRKMDGSLASQCLQVQWNLREQAYCQRKVFRMLRSSGVPDSNGLAYPGPVVRRGGTLMGPTGVEGKLWAEEQRNPPALGWSPGLALEAGTAWVPMGEKRWCSCMEAWESESAGVCGLRPLYLQIIESCVLWLYVPSAMSSHTKTLA